MKTPLSRHLLPACLLLPIVLVGPPAQDAVGARSPEPAAAQSRHGTSDGPDAGSPECEAFLPDETTPYGPGTPLVFQYDVPSAWETDVRLDGDVVREYRHAVDATGDGRADVMVVVVHHFDLEDDAEPNEGLTTESPLFEEVYATAEYGGETVKFLKWTISDKETTQIHVEIPYESPTHGTLYPWAQFQFHLKTERAVACADALHPVFKALLESFESNPETTIESRLDAQTGSG